ncbi:hypothetical protein [Azospirillum sp. HJ39]|uniref:hypothetical protein n=1 Tax=Azospirillum sp. HJ39 TaxID=3159496 RepID=UPI003557B75B
MSSRPCSAVIWMWRSCWVEAVSAGSLRTAVARGGTATPASYAAQFATVKRIFGM